MKRWFRRFVMVVVATGIAAAVVYAFLPKPVPVDLVEVTRGPLRVTVDEDGKTRIREQYIVSAPLGGRLRRIDLEPGDAVTAGQTLVATIMPTDPTLLDARTRAEAQARVRAAEAAVERAKPALESALAAMQFAESEHARARQQSQRGSIARSELERLALLERQRTQEYRDATFAEEIAEFELQQAQSALLRTRPDTDTAGDGPTSDDSTGDPDWHFEINAPITGRVLRVFQESATVVTPGTRLIELGDPQNLEVEIDVLSSDGVKIHPGDRVLLEHWGGDEPLEATVRLVEPSAFTKVSALGVEEQRVNVIADLQVPPEERGSLGDGFRVEARIVIWEQDDVLRVPTSALFRQDEEWAVFRVVDGKAEPRRVTLGRRNGLSAEVLEGLEAGDRVIAHPNDKVTAGGAVVARETSA